jgi:antitoxin MazE
VQTKIQKWGNSLAIRIPKTFATELGIDQDQDVELSLEDGKLVLTALHPSSPTLDMLLQGITDKNLHSETSTGDSVGNEAW